MTEKIPKTCYLEPKLVELYKIEEKKPTLSELLNIAISAYVDDSQKIWKKNLQNQMNSCLLMFLSICHNGI